MANIGMKVPCCMFSIYLKEMDSQCKGSAKGFKQTEMLVASPDVTGTCTSQSKKEKKFTSLSKGYCKKGIFFFN